MSKLYLESISLYLHYNCLCCAQCFSRVRFFATLWTIACQVSLSLGVSKQAYWSELPCPPPGGFPSASVVKSLPAVQEAWVQSLGQEDPLSLSWYKPLSSHLYYCGCPVLALEVCIAHLKSSLFKAFIMIF